MRNRRFRALRQEDRDAVAGQRPECGQDVGQTVGLALNVPEGMRRREAALVLVVQRKATALGGPAATDIDRDIELLRNLPAKILGKCRVAAVRLLISMASPFQQRTCLAVCTLQAPPLKRSSISSIQCRTGIVLPLCRCV
jgi:hypothetical protein